LIWAVISGSDGGRGRGPGGGHGLRCSRWTGAKGVTPDLIWTVGHRSIGRGGPRAAGGGARPETAAARQSSLDLELQGSVLSAVWTKRKGRTVRTLPGARWRRWDGGVHARRPRADGITGSRGGRGSGLSPAGKRGAPGTGSSCGLCGRRGRTRKPGRLLTDDEERRVAGNGAAAGLHRWRRMWGWGEGVEGTGE
jgi:hypothetical protein